ncbi:MAG: hypothetical protein AABX11_00975 [Nanoarchaeota archaeon]
MEAQTMPILVFDDSAKEEILDFIDKAVDDEGFIIEKFNPSQRVITFDGEEISKKEFGGLKKGSEVFIKNDLVSMMRFSKK